MGIGPPVCEKCRVIVKEKVIFDYFTYQCEFCNNSYPKWNAWTCGLSDQELEDNYKFLKFLHKK